jgi:hypothetical protein
MNLTKQITLPGRVSSSAVSPNGDYAVAAVEEDRILLLDGETLAPWGTLTLPTGLDRLPPGTTVRPTETRLTFLDERTLLVARAEYLIAPEESAPLESHTRTRLLALDPQTGNLRGEFQIDACVLRADPVPIPPHHVLLSNNGLALVCVDASSWREVGRVGERAEDHDPAVDIEEEIANNGVAYDLQRGLVHVLWRYYNAGTIQSYRWEPEKSRFSGAYRAHMFEGQDACYEANGLCVRPGGLGIAAWFAVTDAVVAPGGAGEPRMSRLGRLALYSGHEVRFIEVKTEMARDLLVSPAQLHDSEGGEIPLGDRVGVDFYEARPIYLDDSRILLNTPGGFLLGVDTEGGRSEVLRDFRSPILSLELHREKRLLLVCCEDRSAHLMTL